MNPAERDLIAGLFQRMRDFGAPEKDREAEALISQAVRANPDAAYMLVTSREKSRSGSASASRCSRTPCRRRSSAWSATSGTTA